MFADRADGTYSQIDATHAHLNMPATFIWAEGFADRPITIRFRPLGNRWKAATQLASTPQPWTFAAPNLQYMMDSPTELSDQSVREWQVDDQGTARTVRLAVHHDGSEADVDRLAEMVRKVVAEHIKVFGGDVANYDFGTYTVIADYLPQASGDGMEHRNSTIVTGSRGLAEADFAQIGAVSHEFFHSWNVERLRPAELEPFDFTRANPTPSLWFAEGFTNYYGPLAIRRAGLSSIDDFLGGISGALNYVLNTAGRTYGSPAEMSLRAPFVDAATSIDPANPNIFTSYYAYGQVLALALDLQLRGRAGGKTLDDYMRQMWKTHGIAEKPYTTADLERALGIVAGDRAFARSFFEQSIEGSAIPDLAPLLAQAGLTLRSANPGRAWAGAVAFETEGGLPRLSRYPAPETPIYAAGLDKGDRIVSVGGMPIATEADWSEAIGRHAPGDIVDIVFEQRGSKRQARLTLANDPTLEVVRNETIGKPLTPRQSAFRASWMGPGGT